jgi:hypothetical protein
MRHPVRCMALLTPLLLILALPVTTSITFAVAIGDDVKLKATHQAGVPPAPRTARHERFPAHP